MFHKTLFQNLHKMINGIIVNMKYTLRSNWITWFIKYGK